MTAAEKTPSQRGRANRNRGITAERDLCRWLRSNGFPHAERAVRAGFKASDRTGADPGDVTGTPLILWSVKDCAVERIGDWFDELDDMSDNAAEYALVRLIVSKRRGHADPGKWYAWLTLAGLVDLATYCHGDGCPSGSSAAYSTPVRLALSDVVHLLRANGYGIPLEAAS